MVSFQVKEFACRANATLPGASKNSQHIQGRAADFWVEGVPVATVADYAEKLIEDSED